MLNLGIWTRSSRRLSLLLLAVAVPPAITLVWLGWRLVAQDTALLTQRDLERRQAALQGAIHALELRLIDAERHLPDGPVPDRMARFTLSTAGVSVDPADRVLWTAVPSVAPSADDDRRFADAEALEFRGDAARALPLYEAMARAPDPGLRAGARLRIARVHRRAGRWDEAAAAYRALAALPVVTITDSPSDLLARRALCDVLHDAGRASDLAQEAGTLEKDLIGGRWTTRLDRAGWELAAGDLQRWTGRAVPVPADRVAFSAAADALWAESRAADRPPVAPATRRVLVAGDTAVTVLASPRGPSVLVIPPNLLRDWLEQAVDGSAGDGAKLAALDRVSHVLAGPTPIDAPSTIRAPAADTGLPWTLAFSAGESSALAGDLAARRRLLLIGLSAILLLVAGSTFFLWRVMRRELAVARLQTEFVATVSHEFRTPLASLRHVTELLDESDDVPLSKRRGFYGTLGRNTERLQRLVESLLDFARMEGGRKAYDLTPADAGELAGHVVSDFQQELSPRTRTIELDVDAGTPLAIRADAASLSHAIWNLLDNAVKYSPDESVVRVSVRPEPAGIAISVRDEGIGIPANERQAVFERFVRGRAAGTLGIKGTGLGLAIVSHIVRAHGGTIALDSADAAGSTFTIVLPPAARS